MQPKEPFWLSAKGLFLMPVIWMIVFVVIFYWRKEGANIEFQAWITEVPSIQKYGMATANKMENMMNTYGALAGVGTGVVFLIFNILLVIIFAIVRITKWKSCMPFILLLSAGTLLAMAHNILYQSGMMTALSSSIVIFLGKPFYFTGIIMTILSGLIFFSSLGMKKSAKTAAIFIAGILLSGCSLLSWLTGMSCTYTNDKVHCVQEQAVADNDPEGCKNIGQKEGYTNSNPPKDKCYVMIAGNTGDPTVCDDVKGGAGSYSKSECLDEAFGNGSIEQCAKSKDPERCRDMYGQKDGNCGEGLTFNTETQKCETDSGANPECADPSFTSQCKSANTLLVCNDGKKSVKTCEFGCFEAWCRTKAGPTDIEPPKEEVVEETDEDTDKSGDDESDKDEKNDKKEEPEEVGKCEIDSDCPSGSECLDKKCVLKIEGTCEDEWDCAVGETCKKDKCVALPECGKKDFYCLSTTTLQYCEDEKVGTKTCEFGCKGKACLTEKEEEKEKPECKEGYISCASDISLETCNDGKKVKQMCEHGCDRNACRTEPKKNCTGIHRFNPFCSETDDDIEDKTTTDIKTIQDAVGGKYMEMLGDAISGEKDPAKKLGLEKYKEFLEKAGTSMDDVGANIEKLNAIKRIFLDSYDPSMDIENMPVRDILRPGIFDRISDSIFGGPKTEAGKEMAEAETGLTVYEQMLERQAEIDFLKKGRMDRLGNVITEGVKSDMVGRVGDKAKDLAEGVAGSAMIAVSVVDYALTSFQDEAKKQMFVGLSRAYNRRRADIQRSNPNMTEEEIHKKTVADVKDSPYQDAKGRTFIKYGNILENKDCGANTRNQLCIDNKVFWTAMDKTYEHNHSKELHDRWMEQMQR